VTASQFSLLGMSADEAASRAALIDRVTRGFHDVAGAQPQWRWFVPGRIEVFGKHTDYAGGRSLLVAVPRGFGVAARPRNDARIVVSDVLDGARTEVDLGAEARPVDGWASYVHVVARRLAANFAGAPLGADIAILSDLPRAAGLSSSSALVVGVAVALARRGELSRREEWLESIRTTEELAWYLGCVENGLDFPGLRGTAGVGTHGGSEDHTAILACRTGALSQYRFVPVRHLGDAPMPEEWTFVVATSGVHADKSGSVKEQYNRASLMTRVLLERWNANADAPAHSLGAVLTAPDARARLGDIVKRAPSGPFPVDDLLRRLAHFIAEDALVPEAARAFALGDAMTLGRLSHLSQHQAETWLGNQILETRALAALAREAGAFAASSFGAGFGGSVWALITASDSERFARDWLRAYARQFPERTDAECFAARPGPALTEIE
jgi:galactokinase